MLKKLLLAAMTFASLATHAAYETGDPNEVLRVGPAGGRPKYGQINLAAAAAITGALPYANGGTAGTSRTSGFNALAPASAAKGDLLAFNGTDWIRVAVGTDGYLLTADTAQTAGIKWAVAPATPVGTMLDYGGTTAPTGFVLCNGASLLRAGTYADLFAVIGTAFGAADGTHFNVPDARGRFKRMWDNGAGRDPGSRTAMATGGNTGDTIGSIQDQAFLAHTHTYDRNAVGAGVAGGGSYTQSPGSVATGSAGGAETRPINFNVNCIIKY